MKEERGITLISLVVYVVVMILSIVSMSVIIDFFYNNTNRVKVGTQEIIEFNKFNTYFLKEVKSANNEIDKISNNYILFKSGNSFLIENDSIYYNDKKICEGITECKFTQVADKNGEIVKVSLTIGSFSKSINYKLENIY